MVLSFIFFLSFLKNHFLAHVALMTTSPIWACFGTSKMCWTSLVISETSNEVLPAEGSTALSVPDKWAKICWKKTTRTCCVQRPEERSREIILFEVLSLVKKAVHNSNLTYFSLSYLEYRIFFYQIVGEMYFSWFFFQTSVATTPGDIWHMRR